MRVVPRYGRTQRAILAILRDGRPRLLMEVAEATGLEAKRVGAGLYRLWRSRAVLRTETPTYEAVDTFHGRAGIRRNTRAYHLYLYRPLRTTARVQGRRFVPYATAHLDGRGAGVSKAQLIRDFVRAHPDRAFYTTAIADALQDQGVRQQDVMSTVRRAERKGLIYVRGYRTHDRQTPFREGYLVTWIDARLPRETAVEQAVRRTDAALADTAATSPIIQRVHAIRDAVIASSKLRDLASLEFIQNALGCTEYEVAGAVERTMQLYPDVRETKLFHAFRYFYHASLSDADLHAAIALKENYIRTVKGRANRIGHNWEAVPGWFIDSLTAGARFWTQRHRRSMDPRRITLHLLKPVGGRRRNAEVDRVWEVTPGPLLNPTTYVLECKWGLVRKRHLDDFFDVLRWSKEFGVDTPDGRRIKQGITGVFAGSAFDPRDTVRLKDETTLSLASYAARMNLQLLKGADFNAKLRDRGVAHDVTVQRVCRYAKDEREVREILDDLWTAPDQSRERLSRVIEENHAVYTFEKMLEGQSTPHPMPSCSAVDARPSAS